jgi:SAM-dependent methyltransferase
VVTRAQRARSFGSIAHDYDRLRPGPAPEALDWLITPDIKVAVDLAAGTGLLTRALAERVPTVIAVEPDPQMRAVLEERTPGVQVLEGVGEAIPLPDASADALCISSAWHWMDPDRALPEIARVLRDGGLFAVLRSGRDRAIPWVRDLDGLPGQAKSDGGPQSGNVSRGAVMLPDHRLFDDERTELFPANRPMSVEDIVAMCGTYSAIITASAADRAEVLDSVRAELAERFPGQTEIDFPMRTAVWRATRVAR